MLGTTEAKPHREHPEYIMEKHEKLAEPEDSSAT